MRSRYDFLLQRISDGVRACALSLGILYLFLGIAGFLPGFVSLPTGTSEVPAWATRLLFPDGYGYVLGLFPTNFFHDALRIAVGVLGIAATTSLSGSLVFNQGFAIVYGAMVIFGLLPFTNTLFGLMPLFGNNIWFNALTAAAAAYYGFFKPSQAENLGASPSS